MPDDPVATAARCEAWCYFAGTQLDCALDEGHEHEHESAEFVEVVRSQEAGDSTFTPVLVWWGDDGNAFVGSDKAVDTGKIT